MEILKDVAGKVAAAEVQNGGAANQQEANGDGNLEENKGPKFFSKERLNPFSNRNKQIRANESAEEEKKTESIKAIAEVAGAAGSAETAGRGLNGVFTMLYSLIAAIVVLTYSAIVVLTFIDIIRYIVNEIDQGRSIFQDPDVFNKDTNDVEILSYTRTNNSEDEPYSVYLQQDLVGGVLTLTGVLILLLGTQVGIFGAMAAYSSLKGIPFNQKFEIPFRMVGGVLIGGVGALVMTWVYKNKFIKDTQGPLRNIQGQIRDVRSRIYNMMTVNTAFLDALQNDDVDGMATEIVKISQQAAKTPSTDSALDVQKAIFTLNMYSFFKIQIPETNPEYHEWRKMFTVQTIRRRDVDPVKYFYYKQPIYIPNLYPILTAEYQNVLFAKRDASNNLIPSARRDTNGVALNERDDIKEAKMVKDLMSYLGNLNQRLANLYNIPSGKTVLRNYMITFFIYAVLFFALLIMVYWTEAGPMVMSAAVFIGSLFRQ